MGAKPKAERLRKVIGSLPYIKNLLRAFTSPG
jgi:hypothetical protein